MKKIILLFTIFFFSAIAFSENFNGFAGFIPGMSEQDTRKLITEKGYNLSKKSSKTSIIIEGIQISDEPLLNDKSPTLYLGFYEEKLMTISLWLDMLPPEESKKITLSLKEKYISKSDPQESTVISQFTTDSFFYTSNWFLGNISTWDGEIFDISFSDANLWLKSEAERKIQWVNNRKSGR